MRITTQKQVEKIRFWLHLEIWDWVAGSWSNEQTSRLQTKRHLSSGTFYSLLLNYWMVGGKNCWYSPAGKTAAVCVCVHVGMCICSFHYVYARQLSIQICDAAFQIFVCFPLRVFVLLLCVFPNLTMRTVSECMHTLLFHLHKHTRGKTQAHRSHG